MIFLKTRSNGFGTLIYLRSPYRDVLTRRTNRPPHLKLPFPTHGSLRVEGARRQ
jgi:hypothetical protein